MGKQTDSRLSLGIADIKNIMSRYAILLAFLVVFVVLSCMTEYFFTVDNMFNLLRQISFNAIIAVGMTFVIMSGGIDLSVGSTLALSGIILGSLQSSDRLIVPTIVAIIACLGTGFACGLINGVVITKGKAAPFIITMGTMTIYRGLALVFSGGKNVNHLDVDLQNIGTGRILSIPIPIYIMTAIILLGAFVLSNVAYGRHVRAVGGNRIASRASGLNVDRIEISVYVIAGVLAAAAAIPLTARLNAAAPIVGVGYELDAIAAVVIGGTSLSGGVGTIWGTLIGAMLIGTISNGLDLLGVSTYYQDVVQGIIIIIAVLMDKKEK